MDYEAIRKQYLAPMEEKLIYILDDEKIILLDLQRRLERFGFKNVVSFSTPEPAMEAASELKPDLVISDDTMYGPMNGPDVLIEFKAKYDIPVIGLGTMHIEWWIECGKGYLLDSYLLKPFKDRELYYNILNVLYRNYRPMNGLKPFAKFQ